MGHYELRGDGKVWVEDAPPAPRTTSTTSFSSSTSPYSSSRYRSSSGYNNEIVAKVFSILLPILALIVGQVAQFVLYFTQGRVLLLELVFEDVNIYVLCLASALSLISAIMVIYGAWKFADDYEICRCWTYSVVASILLSALPIITGFVGIVATSVITYMINEDEFDYLPLVPAISAFAIGQVIMWFTFVGTEYAVLLSEIWDAASVDGVSLLVPLIISSLCGAIGTAIMSYVGHYFMDECEEGKAFGTMIPFCTIVLFIPAVSCFIALIYSFIVYCCKGRSDSRHSDIKFIPIGYLVIAMASMGLLFLPEMPLYVILIISTIEIGLFCLIFNGNNRLSHYGDDYHWVTIGFFTILALGILVLQILFLERLFPKLVTLSEMVEMHQATQAYYDGAVAETRTAMIIGYIVLAIAMGVGLFTGESNIASILMPLATVGGSTTFLMILNALIKLPGEAGAIYEPSFFLWTLIGSVLIAIPCGIYLLITHFVGDKATYI